MLLFFTSPASARTSATSQNVVPLRQMPLRYPQTALHSPGGGSYGSRLLIEGVCLFPARPGLPLDILPATSSRGFGLTCQNWKSSDFQMNQVFPWDSPTQAPPGPEAASRTRPLDCRRYPRAYPPLQPSPPLRQWRLVARRRPSPTPPLTNRRQALWDWLCLCASSLTLSDWLQDARDASLDWLDQSACAAGFSVASHSWGELPAGRTSRLSLEEGSRLSGKAAAAAK